LEYNEGLCKEKHDRINEKLDLHDKRLNSHADDIDILKISDTKHNEQIDNLIEKIDQILSQNRWFIGIVIVQLLGFFFMAIEKVIYK
jgi:hypothetical protein